MLSTVLSCIARKQSAFIENKHSSHLTSIMDEEHTAYFWLKAVYWQSEKKIGRKGFLESDFRQTGHAFLCFMLSLRHGSQNTWLHLFVETIVVSSTLSMKSSLQTGHWSLFFFFTPPSTTCPSAWVAIDRFCAVRLAVESFTTLFATKLTNTTSTSESESEALHDPETCSSLPLFIFGPVLDN